MRQRRLAYTMENSERPIVTLDGLAHFSAQMRRAPAPAPSQPPAPAPSSGPPPGKRRATRKAAVVVPIRVDQASSDSSSDSDSDNAAIPTPTPIPLAQPVPTPVISPQPRPRPVSRLLLNQLPTERGEGQTLCEGVELDDLFTRYAPVEEKPDAQASTGVESGVISGMSGDVTLLGCAVVFSMIPLSPWRKLGWNWSWSTWPVDVYIEFSGRSVGEANARVIHLCFTLDAARAIPKMTGYLEQSLVPNAVGPGVSKCYFPLDNPTLLPELYRYCQERASSNSVRYAYVDRREDFCARHVPCCGETIAALIRSWSSPRAGVQACPDPGCLPIVSGLSDRRYADTSGDLWTAHRLIYTALWDNIFSRYGEHCERYGLSKEPPGSIQAMFRLLHSVHAQNEG